MNDLIAITLSIFSLVGSIYVFYTWVWKNYRNWWMRYRYYHNTGYYLVKDIEDHFGAEAGAIIKKLISDKGYSILLSQKRLDIIENAINIGIYLCDASGKCTYTNKVLAEMFGLQQSDMLGYGWLQPIIDKQKTHYNWRFSVDNKIPYKDEYEIEVDGETKQCYTEAIQSIEDGIVIGFVGFVRYKDDESHLPDFCPLKK